MCIPRVGILLVLYAGLLLPSAFAQSAGSPYVISDRVGDVIDAQERAYFGLFPRIRDFRQATAYQQTDTTFFFVVEGGPDGQIKRTEQPFSGKTAEAFKLWIEQFESVYRNTRAVPWAYLVKFVKPYRPFRRGGSIDLRLTDGSRVSGLPLYVDADLLLLSTSDECPACVADRDHVVVVTRAQMSFLDANRSLVKKMFFDQRIPNAGRTDIFRRYTLPILRKRMIFKKELAPEIRDSLISIRAVLERTGSAEQVTDTNEKMYPQKRRKLFFSRSITGVLRVVTYPEVTNRAATNTAAHDEEVVPPVYQYQGGVSFDASRKVWVSAHVEQYTYSEIKQNPVSPIGGWGLLAATSQWQTSLLAGYKTDPEDAFYFVRRNLFDFFNKTPVFRFGLGLTYARVTARLYKMRTWIEGGHEMVGYENRYTDQSTLGATALVSAEWYLSRFLAVEFGAQTSGYLPFSIKNPAHTSADARANASAALITGAWIGMKVSPF